MATKNMLKWQEILAMPGQFVFCKDMQFENLKDCRSISKEDFQMLRINNKLTLEHAFVLYAINSLGHATNDMIINWLKLYAKYNEKKAVPELNASRLKKLLKELLRTGMILGVDYINNGAVFNIYTCSSYGHIFFKNTLDMSFASYDDNAIFHAEVETFKRLTTNSVFLRLAECGTCKGATISGKVQFGNYMKFSSFVYASLEMEFDGQTVVLLIEPISFNVNSDITSETELDFHVKNRLDKIKEICEKNKKDKGDPIIPIFCVDDVNGIKKLSKICSAVKTTDIYRKSLYTSEKLLRMSKGDPAISLLTMSWSGEKTSINKAGENWFNIWK